MPLTRRAFLPAVASGLGLVPPVASGELGDRAPEVVVALGNPTRRKVRLSGRRPDGQACVGEHGQVVVEVVPLPLRGDAQRTSLADQPSTQVEQFVACLVVEIVAMFVEHGVDRRQ